MRLIRPSVARRVLKAQCHRQKRLVSALFDPRRAAPVSALLHGLNIFLALMDGEDVMQATSFRSPAVSEKKGPGGDDGEGPAGLDHLGLGDVVRASLYREQVTEK